jgi:hypothetical protein
MFGKHPASPDYGSHVAGICFKGGDTVTQSPPKSSTNSSVPWDAQQPYLKQGFEQAQQQYDSAKPEFYPGSTVAGFNQAQTYAQDATGNRALQGNPVLGMGQQQAQDTLSGKYLNPDLSGVANSIDEQIRPRVGAQFAKAGRNMSPAHAGAYSSGQVGEQQQRMEQTQLQDDVNRWNFGQNIDQNKLRQFMSNISGNYGGTRDTNSTQPVYSNPTSNTLGNIGAAVDIAKSVYTK